MYTNADPVGKYEIDANMLTTSTTIRLYLACVMCWCVSCFGCVVCVLMHGTVDSVLGWLCIDVFSNIVMWRGGIVPYAVCWLPD